MASRKEKTLYQTRTHFKVLAKPIFLQLVMIGIHYLLIAFLPTDTGSEGFNKWGPIVLHGLVIIGELWYVVVPIGQWWTSTFTLTNKRVFKEWGILYRQSREIALQHVVSVNSERGIIDRLFGAGTLVFLDASSSAPNTSGFWNKKQKGEGVRFTDVPKIKHVMNLVEDARFGTDDED